MKLERRPFTTVTRMTTGTAARSIALTLGLVTIFALAGCGGDKAGDNDAATQAVAIEGPLTEASYRTAASKVLAEARAAMSDPALTEARLDAQTGKLEAMLKLAEQLDADKATLNEAELMSTLGGLYVRKAAFHAASAQQAGVYTSRGFRFLDRAVTKYPDNLTARLNRGMTSAKVPDFMHKTAVARDDLRAAMARPEFAKLPSGLQASVKATLAEVEARLAADAQP